MNLKLIACEVFIREVCYSLYKSKHIIDPVFTPKESHNKSDELRALVQKHIDETDSSKYDYIILGFGLCGNSLANIKANDIPLVIPRAHDCCSILLGSSERFYDLFGDNLSAEWTSAGYMERGENIFRTSDSSDEFGFAESYQSFVDQYGADNAKFIWESLHPEDISDEIIFIDIKETTNQTHHDIVKQRAAEAGKKIRKLDGTVDVIEKLLAGDFDDKSFLIVPPEKYIVPKYDKHNVVNYSDKTQF